MHCRPCNTACGCIRLLEGLRLTSIGPAGGQVKQHYLNGYRHSLVAVIQSQIKLNKFEDGEPGCRAVQSCCCWVAPCRGCFVRANMAQNAKAWSWWQLSSGTAIAGLTGILQMAESISLQDTLLAADLDVSEETLDLPNPIVPAAAAVATLHP